MMSDFSEILTSAIEALGLQKTRTALAILGIVIGISSVIALVSIGNSATMSVDNQVAGLGANLLTVSPSSQSTAGVRGAGAVTTLTNDDATAIETSSQINTISQVSPEVSQREQIKTSKENTNTQVVGATSAYTSVHNVNLASGTFISDRDVSAQTKVAVLGPTVVSNLYPATSNVIGQTIRISGVSFKIIGVTVSKGGTGFGNQDNMVFVPLSTAQKTLFGINYLTSMALSAKDKSQTVAAQNQVGYFLLTRHKISDPTQADFTIISEQDIAGAASSVTSTLTTLLAGIAAISLLVGGIGIMNIMFVTVTERTREIGLRKALGAQGKVIILQFLTEATVLTLLGGLIGMIIGVVLSYVVDYFMKLPFAISVSSIFLAIGVSAVIGIVFGWYPAQRASKLSPIEALRYE
jgi:putative ABC transport system permease protein